MSEEPSQTFGDISREQIAGNSKAEESMEEPVLNTEAEQKQREKKPLRRKKKKSEASSGRAFEGTRKTKHKKWIFFIIIICSLVLYYWVSKSLGPVEVEEQHTQMKEGVILFDTGLSQKYSIIGQIVDHFGEKEEFFAQRLFLDLDQETMNESTPIFLSLPPLMAANTSQRAANLKSIGKQMKGAQIALEPRYFGYSLPFGPKQSFTTQNLKYLTIQQMIEDIAFVIDRITSHNFFNITKKNPWILSGSSYSAMIAIWFKAMYPEMVVGVYASSPIVPTLLVPNISEKLYSNAIAGGKTCRAVLQALMKDLQKSVYGDTSEGFLLDMGLGVRLNPEEALYLFMERIRSFNRKSFIQSCSQNDEEKIFAAFKQLFQKNLFNDIDPLAVSMKELSSPQEWDYFPMVRQGRAFQWIRCNQLGLFESVPSSYKHSLNFRQLNQTFFKKRCSKIFSKDLWPEPELFYEKIEEDLRKVENVFIVHGYYDIWLPYAFLPKSSASISTNVIKCSFCGHDFDALFNIHLFKSVDEVRRREEQAFKKWISSRKL